ncbi:RNA polymerase sigma factor [Candidatus Aminicenantes bacterium AC-335-A11]|nr:RNA polymerase sigma factor [SCandidatus Aminicenantes bacterium Aminicenantia_JdfR_composite]MCP2597790.1 RNA polymerase sigma factor [Candidatus Aminicenantes bacterium AC-335-L06]MCP2618471.1 RNA polymerase sigma factor [Candidatus Aminicenantes bacterium AC-335-A11]MCP2620515.1 RNA polymerase sigma factor [Candidatus Aminicenantes bacterium AC-334-E05]
MQEKELIKKLKKKDKKAFELLIEKYQNKIFGLINLIIGDPSATEDLAQEVFLRIFKGIPYFRGKSKLSTWIYRITYNVCMAEIKKSKKAFHIFNNEKMEFSLNNFHSYIHEKVNKIELEKRIRKILHTLPINYRIVIIFYYWQELTYYEIAEALKIPVGTVKTYLHRAKKLLKQKILEEKNEL